MSWSKQNNLLEQNLAPWNQNSQRLKKGVLPQQVEVGWSSKLFLCCKCSGLVFCSIFFHTELLPKITLEASEGFLLFREHHFVVCQVEGTWKIPKQTLCACMFFHFWFLSYYYESTVPPSIYYSAKITRELALFSQDRVSPSARIVEITSEVHSCTSLMRQLEPHSLLHWLTEQKLLRKCEASGFLCYFNVIVGNFSKKSRFSLTIVSLLGKIIRKEAHQ